VKNVGLDDAAHGTSGGAGFAAASSAAQSQPVAGHPGAERAEQGTRARIARLILENGPLTAAGLSGRLGLTPAAVRRHLDNLLAEGMIEAREARCYGSRGRGRPARLFAITDAGRSAFEHAYDDLAASALRFLAETLGDEAVAEFARRKISDLERRYRPVVDAAPAAERVQALAEALSADGYAAAASVSPAAVRGTGVKGDGPRCRRVSAALRGGDGGIRPPARDPGAAPGHDLPRRRDLHHPRDSAVARAQP
jgi:predicted ArsR family transcriptional regulator